MKGTYLTCKLCACFLIGRFYRICQIAVAMFVPESIVLNKKFIVTNVMLVHILLYWRKLSRSKISLTCKPPFSKLYARGKLSLVLVDQVVCNRYNGIMIET